MSVPWTVVGRGSSPFGVDLQTSPQPAVVHLLNGISQPAVKDFDTKPDLSQETVRQGVIPFLPPRYLFQLVPEFESFLNECADPLHGISTDLIDTRLMGRWQSGALTDLFPLQDDPVVRTDPSQCSNFMYDPNRRDHCPFTTHICKANPRADLESHQRQGPHCAGLRTPSLTRTVWMVFARSMAGIHPDDTGTSFPLPADWVVPKGGKYFFSPSIAAPRSVFVLA